MAEDSGESPAGRLSRRRLLRTSGALGVGSLVGITPGRAQVGGELLWTVDQLVGTTVSPVIDDGTIAVYSLDEDNGAGMLWVGDSRDGSTDVTDTVDEPFRISLTIVDGMMYWSGYSRTDAPAFVAAINIDDQTRQWVTPVEASQLKGPSVADGTLYVSEAEDDVLRAFDATTGSQRWDVDLAETALPVGPGFPTIAEDTLFLNSGAVQEESESTSRGSLYAFDPETGSERWQQPLGGYAEPATVSNGTVFVSSYVTVGAESILRAFDTTSGSQQWQLRPAGAVFLPTVADGTVFLGTTDGSTGAVQAVDAETGAEQWATGIDGQIRTAPTVADGVVFVCTEAGSVQAFDATDGTRRWTYDLPNAVTGSPVVFDGTVFVPAEGALYALDAGVAGSSDGSRVRQGIRGHHDGLRGRSVTITAREANGLTIRTREQDDRKITTVSVADATAGESVTVPLELGVSGAVRVAELSVTPRVGGAFEITITSDDRPLETTPETLTLTDEERTEYFDVDRILDDDETTEGTFRYESHLGFLSVDSTLDDADIEELAFRYELDPEAPIDSEYEAVSLYRFERDADPPEWTTRPTTVTERDEGIQFETTASGFSEWTIGTVRPSLTLREATADVSTTQTAEQVTIDVTIQNRDDASAIYVTELLFEGNTVERQRPRIPADGSIAVRFTQDVSREGTYTIRVNNVEVETVTAGDDNRTGDDRTQQASLGGGTEDSPPVWPFALGGLGALGGGSYLLRRSGDDATDE